MAGFRVPFWLAFVCALVGFLVVIVITPYLIRYLKRIGLVDMDQNKKDKPTLPISGGFAVLGGLLAGLMLFIFVRKFFPGTSVLIPMDSNDLNVMFASITSILLITMVGFVDDLLRIRGDGMRGLKQWLKPLMTIVAAVPLMVVNAGVSVMNLPFVGDVEFGLLYPLLLVPIGVVGAANMVNLLAGFNGLESGMGIVYMGMLGLFAYVHHRYVAALIALMIFAALIAFYFYNKDPAKILPGDSLTYLLGAGIATIAIVGNLEKAAIIVSLPFIVEFFLKLRGRFQRESVGFYHQGKVKSKYDRIYSLVHIMTRTGRFSEKQIVYTFILAELLISGLIWIIK